MDSTSTPTLPTTIDALLANRKKLLAQEHRWATPEVCAELKATNRAIRVLTGSKAIKRGATIAPTQDAVKPESGDNLLVVVVEDPYDKATWHEEWGELIGQTYSGPLKQILYRVVLQNGRVVAVNSDSIKDHKKAEAHQ